MNFRRLNYILIPETAEQRARYQRSAVARGAARLFGWLYMALTMEGRWVLALALLAGFRGLDVLGGQNHILWAALVSCVLASLAVRGAFAMPGVQLEVTAPARVQCGDPATFEVVARNNGDTVHHALSFERPLLNWDGSWLDARPAIRELDGHESVRLSTQARFDARGWHDVGTFAMAARLPFRLARGPTVTSSRVRVLVVPRVAAVRQVKIPSTARVQPGGVALASKTGEATELFGLRPYRRGDRLRDLHAKTWARRREPVVRDYRQEYFTRVGVVVDTDKTIGDEDALEASLSLAAGIVGHLSRGEALIDLLVTGQELRTLTVGRSLGTFEQALDHLGAVQPGPAFETDALTRLLGPYLGRLSSVVFLALRWDAERARLAEEIRRRGVACKVLVVDGRQDVEGDIVHLSAATIVSGRPLAL